MPLTMRHAHPIVVLTAAVSAVAAGCAGVGALPTGATQTVAAASTAPSTAPPTKVAGLTAEELGWDCKKLTGRMQLRILELRDYEQRKGPTSFAQTVGSAINGGSKAPQNADARHAHDRSQLNAYNQRLAEMNCATFNLDQELTPKDYRVTPAPVPPPEPDKKKNKS